MTTKRQLTTNRFNSCLSTGPRTLAGKARSARNALRHGLRSESPLLPGERPEVWEAHRDGIVQSLAPLGGLEQVLAERVALCTWRLRRVVAYETAVTALGMTSDTDPAPSPSEAAGTGPLVNEANRADRLAKAEQELQTAQDEIAVWQKADSLLQDLPGLPDDRQVNGTVVLDLLRQITFSCWAQFPGSRPPDPDNAAWLIELGVPPEQTSHPERWAGWTVGHVRQACVQVANAAKVDCKVMVARVLADGREDLAKTRRQVVLLKKEVTDLRRQVAVSERGQHQSRWLPDVATLDKVMRYEGHLSRQMLQALHTLERLQAARAGLPVCPPAVLDVSVDVSHEAAGPRGTDFVVKSMRPIDVA